MVSRNRRRRLCYVWIQCSEWNAWLLNGVIWWRTFVTAWQWHWQSQTQSCADTETVTLSPSLSLSTGPCGRGDLAFLTIIKREGPKAKWPRLKGPVPVVWDRFVTDCRDSLADARTADCLPVGYSARCVVCRHHTAATHDSSVTFFKPLALLGTETSLQ